MQPICYRYFLFIEISDVKIACRCEALQLKNFTVDYIILNYDAVSKTKTFDDLDKQTVLEITRESCKLLQQVSM